ncbi:hypothetical protein C2845_PM03G20640 [Panicum miliaceum]|uniref:Protein kinase domain-containing protein n=1 Tax=Panicum miliaceum TaxID=4540 RepID=A0A3L6TA01_PANMI|nr:hypothetical protein C2845_PM03G20640 [Panicum miliaceum]
MELAEAGQLYDHVAVRERLPEAPARRLFQQLVAAVAYCHRSMVVHGDLKMENVLLDSRGDVKIADFGFSELWASRYGRAADGELREPTVRGAGAARWPPSPSTPVAHHHVAARTATAASSVCLGFRATPRRTRRYRSKPAASRPSTHPVAAAAALRPTVLSQGIGPDDVSQYPDDVSQDWLHRNETYTRKERSNNDSLCDQIIIEKLSAMSGGVENVSPQERQKEKERQKARKKYAKMTDEHKSNKSPPTGTMQSTVTQVNYGPRMRGVNGIIGEEAFDSGLWKPDDPIHGVEDQMDPNEVGLDNYEDDEARVFHSRGELDDGDKLGAVQVQPLKKAKVRHPVYYNFSGEDHEMDKESENGDDPDD